jgi:hypothetical protein
MTILIATAASMLLTGFPCSASLTGLASLGSVSTERGRIAINAGDRRWRHSPAAAPSASSAAFRSATDDDNDVDNAGDGLGAPARDRCCHAGVDSSATASSAIGNDGAAAEAEALRHISSILLPSRRHHTSNVSKVSFQLASTTLL